MTQNTSQITRQKPKSSRMSMQHHHSEQVYLRDESIRDCTIPGITKQLSLSALSGTNSYQTNRRQHKAARRHCGKPLQRQIERQHTKKKSNRDHSSRSNSSKGSSKSSMQAQHTTSETQRMLLYELTADSSARTFTGTNKMPRRHERG